MMQYSNDNVAIDSQFDPDLPTAKHVLTAIACVATQYALNPSLRLARLALHLATHLKASEYGQADDVKEVAHRLIAQWDCVVEQYLLAQANIMPQHQLLQ
jgi:hypothetical protein